MGHLTRLTRFKSPFYEVELASLCVVRSVYFVSAFKSSSDQADGRTDRCVNLTEFMTASKSAKLLLIYLIGTQVKLEYIEMKPSAYPKI